MNKALPESMKEKRSDRLGHPIQQCPEAEAHGRSLGGRAEVTKLGSAVHHPAWLS